MRMHHIFHRAMHRFHHHDHFGFDEQGFPGEEARYHGRHGSERDPRHDWHAIGRRGPFGGGHDHHDGFGDWSDLRGGGRRGGGRMFGHGDLKLLLLALIEQQPRHGYELIRMIEDMFHGHYTPSPGAIYPTLTMLEEMGYASVEAEQGGRKLYAITDAGRAFLEENRAAVDAVNARTEHSARMAAKMSMPMAVRKAMHALKHALLMRGTDWGKADTQRVASILEQAAADIAAATRGD